MTILADHPAVTILALPEDHDMQLTNDKGYCRTGVMSLYVRAFPGDRYEFIRSFTVGCDSDDATKVWAFGNGAMLTAEPRDKEIAVGCDLGDTIRIEGREYRVDPAPNNNIALTAI